MTTDVKKLREERGLSQSDVAGVLGRSQVWLSLIERGRIQPDAETLVRICVAMERLIEFRRAVLEAAKSLPTEVDVCSDLRLRPFRGRKRRGLLPLAGPPAVQD